MRCHLLAVLFAATISVSVAAQSEKYFVSDGVRIRFVDQGAGQPVVLIHGLLGSLDDWRRTTRILDDLSRDHRVIAFDLRGHGQSDKPLDPAAYGVRLTDDVRGLLDHLKIERAHIVGYSFGGAVAGKLLVTNPERFASAILGGSAVRQRGTQQEIDAAESQAVSFLADPPMGPMLRRAFPTLSDAELRERSRQIIGPSNPQALAAFVRGGVSLAVTEADLAKIRVPVLAIVGSNDPALRGVNELKTVLPAMSVKVIDGGVHIIDDERGTPRFPDFLVAIREFIKGHPAQPGLAGKWTGTEQGRGNATYPVTLELIVKGEEATGTVSIGDDPVKTLTNGKVEGSTVTFTTSAMMNGREIAINWRGELKDDRLALTRRLAGGPEMSPLSLQRAAP